MFRAAAVLSARIARVYLMQAYATLIMTVCRVVPPSC